VENVKDVKHLRGGSGKGLTFLQQSRGRATMAFSHEDQAHAGDVMPLPLPLPAKQNGKISISLAVSQ
jgi:hypothetical protein